MCVFVLFSVSLTGRSRCARAGPQRGRRRRAGAVAVPAASGQQGAPSSFALLPGSAGSAGAAGAAALRRRAQAAGASTLPSAEPSRGRFSFGESGGLGRFPQHGSSLRLTPAAESHGAVWLRPAAPGSPRASTGGPAGQAVRKLPRVHGGPRESGDGPGLRPQRSQPPQPRLRGAGLPGWLGGALCNQTFALAFSPPSAIPAADRVVAPLILPEQACVPVGAGGDRRGAWPAGGVGGGRGSQGREFSPRARPRALAAGGSQSPLKLGELRDLRFGSQRFRRSKHCVSSKGLLGPKLLCSASGSDGLVFV